MSIDSSAVLLYGFKIDAPQVDGDREEYASRLLREASLSQAGVGYAKVGAWDREAWYLCTQYHSAELHEPESLAMKDDAETCARWDGLLNAAARVLGVTEHDAPNWLLLVSQT